MGDRLTDDELRAAAARRPGYATYPEYRPGQPERLGQLPAVPAPPVPVSPIRLLPFPGPPLPTEWSRALAAALRDGAPRPEMLPAGLSVEAQTARPSAAAPPAPLDARPARPTPAQPAPDAPLADLPESAVYDFQPVRISARPWWLPRWHWAVMYAGARVRHGYAWTEAGARRRTARAARRVGGRG
ncbi:hypothetical protein ACIBBG_32115 [Micromonospora chersina]|uniref:hypothetical protein n=1 Tax=Micromonospora chersina TaxID=47854 RepID=UPI0037ACB41A